MPQNSASPQSLEASVRQLIANGKSKTALDNAKALHKALNTSESESLLLDAYEARIRSLLDQKMTAEAASLMGVVRERFPVASDRLAALKTMTAARGGDLAGLLGPLNDPALSRERRADIELRIQTELTDLAALADCPALPPEHTLRQAAGALHRAFGAVTSGPVTDGQIALPEVSHRSPLAPWKILIRAIASFYRGKDEECLRDLEGIRAGSVPARLAPALRALAGQNAGKPLKPAEAALLARTTVSFSALRTALTKVDEAFETDESESRIIKAIRDAVRECQRSAPDVLAELRLVVSVRARVADLNPERVIAALEGAPRRNAEYFRMLARTLEDFEEPDATAEACESWIAFCEQAVREGLFRADSMEIALVYLHMAEILRELPPWDLRAVRESGFISGPGGAEDRWFLFPEKLYERACAIDPHRAAFAGWMHSAGAEGARQAENVAKKWHAALPKDIEPLLFLIAKAEKRNAFPTALSYLEKAEKIDAVNPVVRAARLRLLVASALSQLQKKKPHLATQKLTAIGKLPQAGQGDRPAFLAALRHLICVISKDRAEEAAAARGETEKLLGEMSGDLLIFGIANLAKVSPPVRARLVKNLGNDERAQIPASIARVMGIASDLGIRKFQLPLDYFAEAERQFPSVKETLDIEQLKSMGELGLANDRKPLAWNASTEGLKRGGESQPHFLFLRARALPSGDTVREVVIASAASELGRIYNDVKVVDQAVEFAREITGGNPISLTEKQARDVVSRELEHPDFHANWISRPDYSDLLPRRGVPPPISDEPDLESGFDSPFDRDALNFDDFGLDDDEMEKLFNERSPAGMTPEVKKVMFEVLKQAFLTGEPPDEIIGDLIDDMKKRGRKR